MSYKILLADDNASFVAKCLRGPLHNEFVVDTALSPSTCLDKLRSNSYDIVILDIHFSGYEQTGLSLIPQIRAIRPDQLILMLSDDSDRDTVVASRRCGADDFASKANNSLEEVVTRVKALIARREEADAMPHKVRELAESVGAAYASSIMENVFKTASIVKQASKLNVLIVGPTGSGKELVAEAISRKSEKRPFIELNCAAIPETLMESIFLGYERGAYTGAGKNHPGKFEEAHGGDIFLDEVGCLSLKAQGALLRILETRQVTRLNDTKVRQLEFRVISATNEDLDAMVKAGTFRDDLHARLKGSKIVVPPLAERAEDIPGIIKAILRKEGREGTHISLDCVNFLQTLPWPRNVRQLRQVLVAMLAMNRTELLTLADVPQDLLDDITPESQDIVPRTAGNTVQMEFSIDVTFDEVQRAVMRRLIEAKKESLGCHLNQTTLAQSLQIPRSSLQRYLKELSIAVG